LGRQFRPHAHQSTGNCSLPLGLTPDNDSSTLGLCRRTRRPTPWWMPRRTSRVGPDTTPKVEGTTRTGRLDKRCHSIQWGDERFNEWFHAYVPSASDAASIKPDDSKSVHAFADKLLLMSESSFADEGYQSAGELPFDLFAAVVGALITSGRLVKSDGSCHGA
jgi:hypothetical protein